MAIKDFVEKVKQESAKKTKQERIAITKDMCSSLEGKEFTIIYFPKLYREAYPENFMPWNEFVV